MTDTQSTVDDFLAGRDRQPAAAAPSSIGDIWSANWDAAGLSTLGAGKSFGDARSDIVSAIEGAAGKPLGQYAREQGLPLGAAGNPDDNIRELADIAGTLPPDKQKLIEPLLDWRKRAEEKAHALERNAADVNASAYGLSANAVRLAAGIARQAVDPLNIAAMAVTAPIGGEASLPLWQVFARQALAAGAAQALQEPSIQATRAELGLEHGFGVAGEDVIGAATAGGLMGGGLATLLRGGAAALRLARRSRPGAPGEISAPEPRPAGRPTSESPSPAAGPSEPPLAPADLEAAAHLAERNQAVDAVAPEGSDQAEHGARVADAGQALEQGRPLAEPELAPGSEPLGAGYDVADIARENKIRINTLDPSMFKTRVSGEPGGPGVMKIRGPYYDPADKSVNLPRMSGDEFRAAYGADEQAVIAHEVAHALLDKWDMTGSIAGPENKALRAELTQASQDFRQSAWDQAPTHTRKSSELMADGLAVYMTNPEARAQMPLFREMMGTRLDRFDRAPAPEPAISDLPLPKEAIAAPPEPPIAPPAKPAAAPAAGSAPPQGMIENAEAYKAAAKKRREASGGAGAVTVYPSAAARDRARGVSVPEARARHAAAAESFNAMLGKHDIAGADVPDDVRASAIDAMLHRGFGEDPSGALDYAMAQAERDALADVDLHSVLAGEHLDGLDAARYVLETEGSHDFHDEIPFGSGEGAAGLGREAAGQAGEAPAAGEPAPENRAGPGARGAIEPGLAAEREAEGQLVLPGGERISNAELAQRRADQALKPKVAQKPMDAGLFGDEAKQLELGDRSLAADAERVLAEAGGDFKIVLDEAAGEVSAREALLEAEDDAAAAQALAECAAMEAPE